MSASMSRKLVSSEHLSGKCRPCESHSVDDDTVTARERGFDRNLTSYGDAGFSRYLRGVFLSAAGYDRDDLKRPVIGIADLSSDYNPCHRAMPELVAAVKRGVL